MIVHQGVRYWTTAELTNSLEARGIVPSEGSKDVRHRRALRWAERVDLRPSARTRSGGLLWGEDETREALEVDIDA